MENVRNVTSALFRTMALTVTCFPQACNPKYSDYDKTGSICASENINDTLTRYRWLVSAPAGPDGVTSPMREVDFDTFFTSSKMITLDSIYFQPGSRVQCAARAVNANGNEGLELMSAIVTISREEGTLLSHKSLKHANVCFLAMSSPRCPHALLNTL